MNTRTQRLDELVQARSRIDAQIRRLAPATEIPSVDPFAHASTRRLADLAVHMVQRGMTHHEIAGALHITRETASALIAGRVAATTPRSNP